MSAIYYNITATNVSRLVSNFHHTVRLGYAYETDTHYVHFYGQHKDFYSIQAGLAVTEKKSKSQYQNLLDWVTYYFGAENINPMKTLIGETIEGVWRPGLYYAEEIHQGLNTNESERRLCEQALKILLEKLEDLFLYIEPDEKSMSTYSHKTRELLILACTEVENFWTHFMIKSNASALNRNFNTKDYVKLKDRLHLGEYKFKLKSYSFIPSINPFENWDEEVPTASLEWYNAYNKTKHNRTSHFSEATLLNALTAVIGNIVLYIVRFSPFAILEENGTFYSIINQYFNIELDRPNVDTFYIPKIQIPDNYIEEISPVDAHRNGLILPYDMKPLII